MKSKETLSKLLMSVMALGYISSTAMLIFGYITLQEVVDEAYVVGSALAFVCTNVFLIGVLTIYYSNLPKEKKHEDNRNTDPRG